MSKKITKIEFDLKAEVLRALSRDVPKDGADVLLHVRGAYRSVLKDKTGPHAELIVKIASDFLHYDEILTHLVILTKEVRVKQIEQTDPPKFIRID